MTQPPQNAIERILKEFDIIFCTTLDQSYNDDLRSYFRTALLQLRKETIEETLKGGRLPAYELGWAGGRNEAIKECVAEAEGMKKQDHRRQLGFGDNRIVDLKSYNHKNAGYLSALTDYQSKLREKIK